MTRQTEERSGRATAGISRRTVLKAAAAGGALIVSAELFVAGSKQGYTAWRGPLFGIAKRYSGGMPGARRSSAAMGGVRAMTIVLGKYRRGLAKLLVL